MLVRFHRPKLCNYLMIVFGCMSLSFILPLYNIRFAMYVTAYKPREPNFRWCSFWLIKWDFPYNIKCSVLVGRKFCSQADF